MKGDALYLVQNAAFIHAMNEIERLAVEQMVNAKPGDDETRRNFACEVRAIRRVRDKLTYYASGDATVNDGTTE